MMAADPRSNLTVFIPQIAKLVQEEEIEGVYAKDMWNALGYALTLHEQLA